MKFTKEMLKQPFSFKSEKQSFKNIIPLNILTNEELLNLNSLGYVEIDDKEVGKRIVKSKINDFISKASDLKETESKALTPEDKLMLAVFGGEAQYKAFYKEFGIKRIVLNKENRLIIVWQDDSHTSAKPINSKDFDPRISFSIAFTKHILGKKYKLICENVAEDGSKTYDSIMKQKNYKKMVHKRNQKKKELQNN